MRDLRRGLGRTALSWLVLGTLVLTGCSAKQEANDTLPTASASPTAELPPVGPPDFPVPAEARTKDAAGAEAFLRYWIDLLNRQQSVPDGDPLRDLGPDCNECLRIARVYDEAEAAGRRFEGGELAVVEAGAPVLEGAEARVVFIASEEAVRLIDSAGAAVEALEAAPRLSSGLTLTWSERDQCWLVRSMTLG